MNNNIIKHYYDIQLLGSQKIQEDLIIIFDYLEYKCFFMFDGHGSKLKDNKLIIFLKNKFEKIFIEFFRNIIIDYNNLNEFFIFFDKLIFEKKFIEGSCLSFLIINDLKYNCLYGNIGDCMVFLYTKDDNIIKTDIHNFEILSEIDRYKNYGFSLFIKNKRYKGINVSRSIGDYNIRKYIDSPFNGIPTIYELKDITKIKYIVLNSDGLDSKNEINNTNIIKQEYYIHNIINEINIKEILNKKQYYDNTSCIIIYINKFDLLLEEYYFECFSKKIKKINKKFIQSLRNIN